MKQLILVFSGILGGFTAAGLVILVLSPPRGEPVTLLPPPTSEPYTIHICGAIATPGVYNLPTDAIVADAINAAGGTTEKADLETINLAAAVADGQKLYIPYLQPTSSASTTAEQTRSNNDLVNLNLAEAPELERLPGIGPATAKKIVEFRDLHGPFIEIDDLLQVSGIGEAKLEQIRDMVTVY
ncbi:MAG: ComEA family DNA-binding protein [Anaerolineales bacterium]|nr:ComEA family DNA-binding protein [Anaerolineales bacterium]